MSALSFRYIDFCSQKSIWRVWRIATRGSQQLTWLVLALLTRAMQAKPKNHLPRRCGLSARIHISTVSTAPTSGKYSGNTSGRPHFSFMAVSQSPYRAPTKSPLSAHKVPTPRSRSWRAPTKSPPRRRNRATYPQPSQAWPGASAPKVPTLWDSILNRLLGCQTGCK